MKENIELNNEKIEDSSGLKEKWDEEFDNDYNEFKSSNPEKYEKLKDKFISEKIIGLESENLAEEMTGLNVRQEQKISQKDREIDDIWDQLEWLNSRHEDLIGEYKKSLIESTTGLKRRENLYKEMDNNLGKLLGVSDFRKKSDQEVLKLLTSVKPEVYSRAQLSVMLGDMAYLSLANEDGHREGDELLGRVGKAVKEELPGASRHGGDEFTALVLLDFNETEKKVKGLEESIKKLKKLPILERYDLEPSMDIGTAHIGEALGVFNEIIGNMKKSDKGRKKLGKIDILKEFEDTWLEIADKRSFIKKGKERIKLLIKTKKDRPKDYSEVIDFLRKGGYSIKDDELDILMNKTGSVKKEDGLIYSFIKEKEKASLDKLKGYNRVRAEAILKHVEPEMLE